MSTASLLPTPPDPPAVSADTVASGPIIPAMERITLFSPVEWEAFTLEWADSLRAEYELVEKCGGAGDLGRDIIATVTEENPQIWDNYQCKHYNHPLRPADIWVELGKAVYHAYRGEFAFPRKYRFVAPQGVGTSLVKLLKKPPELKQRLVNEWDKHCRTGITSTAEVLLEGDLRKYLDSIDFTAFGHVPVQRLIDEHRKTRWHVARFGGGLPPRPPVPPPPTQPGDVEVVYLNKLFAAYAEHRGISVACLEDLANVNDLRMHCSRSREEFYSAESLKGFSRDTLPLGSFEELQTELFSGVQDILCAPHADGFQRVLAVVQAARQLQLTRHALVPRLDVRDRGGICHQMANERDEVRWINE